MGYAIGGFILFTFLLALIAFTGGARGNNLSARAEHAISSGKVEETLREFRLGGHKLAAIKMVRDACGLDLKSSKELVDRWFEGDEVPLPPLVNQYEKRKTPPPPEATEPTEEVCALYRQGKKIDAIKLYREQTGVGLKEAKEMVETITL